MSKQDEESFADEVRELLSALGSPDISRDERWRLLERLVDLERFRVMHQLPAAGDFSLNAGQLLAMLEEKDGRTRESVAYLARRIDLPRKTVEKALLDHVARRINRNELGFALGSLGFVGSRASVPVLRKFVEESKHIAPFAGAIHSLGVLHGAASSDLYDRALRERSNYQFKRHAIRVLLLHGDDRAVDAMEKRIRQILARANHASRFENPSAEFEPDLVLALRYLAKHAADREAELIAWIWFRKRDFLDEYEKEFVSGRKGILKI